MNSFAKDLSAILREHPENLTSLAKKAGISRPSLYDLINGKNLPKPTTLGNLIDALDLSKKPPKTSVTHTARNASEPPGRNRIYSSEKRKLSYPK